MLNKEQVKIEGRQLVKDFRKGDRFLTWLYQPHTVIALIFVGILVIYVAFTRDESKSFEDNIKFGLGAVCLVYLTFSALQNKDGLFIRPHPVIWRITMGLSVLYLCLMVFMLFQTVDDVRNLLHHLDPSLGKPLPERSYAEHCEIFTPNDPESMFRNIRDAIHDEFFIAHLLGWFGKGLLLRDMWLCWIWSIGFEFMELSFEHMLPNFAECWWDHIILDILFCNAIGIYLGVKTAQYFQMRPYNFVAKISNIEEYQWEILKSWKRLIGALAVILVVALLELNAFFLKFVLYIPPPHFLNVIRLILWWGIGLPGVREWYQYLTDSNCKKMGVMSWMCLAVVGVESLICIKFGRGMFPKPHPPIVIWSWTIAFSLLFLLAVWWFEFKLPQQVKTNPNLTGSSDSNALTDDENDPKKND